MSNNTFTRREGLSLAAIAAGVAALPTVASAAGKSATAASRLNFTTRLDFKDPVWNRDTYARIDGDVDPTKEKCGWLRGKAFGVRDNEKIRPLFIAEGFSFTRMKRLDDGSWRRMLREVVFYRDIETGKLLDTWDNPYTGEKVKVVPIANDPFNFTISDKVPEPPSYGGLQKVKTEPKPFLMDWMEGPEGTLIVNTDIDMIYPNALQPDKWPRESSGVMNRVSEHFIYTVKREDVLNPNLTHIPHIGAWTRMTPWLPWMLMGQAPGHITYFTTFQTLPGGIKELPQDLVEAARAMDEKWLHSPTEDYGPSLSSLENYAREQKPAPVPAGWSPPQPPAAPKKLG
ncbi:DUF1838 family protein [Novosphingobium resinovorum]|uniref:DUF1838 domain-containing protein n=1 Tax=Novosphingobium resinovorum TaxID=158500 RepID=A0A031JLH0_9SPHN|nr:MULTISPECIES: DUF1838 family protein [Novosphingobium]AOR79560.1 hypothetical protein BES08_22415 [Novosphingobium resinovorum]EZP75680.1 hypothetical protein BV97_04545 [Novosphingobium resinovorum]MBF7013508.1 DUF1838 family protein [Novosphingobium sp. HR1a]WJM25656.1 DUF1838 family protein [Novosphingobium resinovorum]